MSIKMDALLCQIESIINQRKIFNDLIEPKEIKYENSPSASQLIEDINKFSKSPIISMSQQTYKRYCLATKSIFEIPDRYKYDEDEEGVNMSSDDCYYMSVDKLRELGIEIKHIEHDYSKFTEGSCLGGGTDVFVFFCRKNNYIFCVEFVSDGDCKPGLLYVNDVYNTVTKEIVRIGCDMFCQNTSYYKCLKFKTLLDSADTNAYLHTVYDKYTELMDKLNCDNIKAVHYDNNYFRNKFNTNDYDMTFAIVASINDDKCCLVPYEDQLVFVPAKELNDTITINGLNSVRYEGTISYKYENISELNHIKNMIVNYIDVTHGRYGYFEQDKFFNGKTIEKYMESLPQKDYTFIVIDNVNYQNAKSIDTKIYINHNLPRNIYNHDANDNSYPMDYYMISVNYDGAECMLNIQGAWHNVMHQMDSNDVIHLQNVDFSGSFTEIMSFIGKFIEKLNI